MKVAWVGTKTQYDIFTRTTIRNSDIDFVLVDTPEKVSGAEFSAYIVHWSYMNLHSHYRVGLVESLKTRIRPQTHE